jgi:hypothetical protein
MLIRTNLISSFRFAILLSIASLWLANPLPGQTFGVSPSNVNAVRSQRIQFSIKSTGASQSVVWSLMPAVGTISPSGLYTAPSSISSMQKVWVLAASSGMSARALVYLQPGTNVSISPSAVSLSLGESKQFSATVTGTTNLAVSWSLNPAVGTITSAGLYKAPQTLASSQTVTLTARSVADPTKSASALLTVTVPAPVTLPVEVMGPNGTTIPVSVTVPVSANVSGNLKLWMQIHALDYENKISVQVNNALWISLNTTTTNLLGLANQYGGIGGGFHTLKLTVNLPSGYVQNGLNTVRFRFNMTDGRSSGFRVLAFNFQKSDGTLLLPPDMFVDDNPSLWEPPLTSPSDISTGKTLWFQAPLTVPTGNGRTPIRARCGNCHAQDGRDLKYFNYSNYAITARSVFHGLSAQQGDQIASYIRTLPISSPGRPWNPPYQPGPGLDSQPETEWAAGAGLGSVLNSDQELLNEIFPTGIQSAVFSPSGNLNSREIRIPLQLPDWNMWLPGVHPVDAWGDEFLNSQFYQDYLILRSKLRYADPVAYANAAEFFRLWTGHYMGFIMPKTPNQSPNFDPNFWTPLYIQKTYATPLWAMVKSWEINQEFGLEGMARTVFLHPLANSRAWFTQFPFFSSPNMQNIPRGFPGLQNSKLSTHVYLSHIWYQLQLVLNNSNRSQEGNSPIDWGYIYGILSDFSKYDSSDQAALLHLWLITGLQISNNGIGAEVFDKGWNWLIPDINRLVAPASAKMWASIPSSTRTALHEEMVKAWLTEVRQFTPQQFYTRGYANPTVNPRLGAPDGTWVDRVWYMIPQFRYYGVSQTLIDQLADWAKTVWPGANWQATKTASCWLKGDGYVTCSTEYP